MMEIVKCDKCWNECGPEPITLKGFTGLSGGILLPDGYHVKDFCGPDCFLKWLREDAQIDNIRY